MSRDPFLAQVLPPSATATAQAAPAAAVEIVTALGSSVVAVDQLAPAPARSSRARLCAVLGGGLLLAAATTFAIGVHDAARDARDRTRWHDQGRPAWAFHETRHTVSADALALGGALGGLGLCAASLLLSRRPARTAFKVGVGDGVDVALADAGRDHTLVKADGHGGFVVDIAGLAGELRGPGRAVSLAELQAAGTVEIPVRTDTHVRTQLGRTTFHVRGLHAPARPVGPAPFLAEKRGLTFLAGSIAAHTLLLGLMSMASPDQASVASELDVDEANQMIAVTNSLEEPPPPPPVDGAENGGTATIKGETSMALTDGTLGHPDGSTNPARLQVANRGEHQLSSAEALAVASNSGVLAAFAAIGPIKTLDGFQIASGMDDIDFTGGPDGSGDGAPVGSFGWGVSGFGVGCGTADHTLCQGVHAGPYGTLGDPRGNGHDYHLLPGNGPGPGHRVAAVPKVNVGKPTACSDDDPCLDPQMIRRYIHRNIEKISYCYEKELLGRPSLEGTVTANFTLNGNGVVVDSRAAGVDPNVSSCIAGVISTISFPKVGGTGIYPIKYPFVLRPTGQGNG
ncbi:MAG TPA: AgmX/PglI C-terminal domain-containing protein [Kofleriaceae bacterium]|nr:AgmX/PglI C-terminal domain-containing protein [Kofleriaceae bacterium]